MGGCIWPFRFALGARFLSREKTGVVKSLGRRSSASLWLSLTLMEVPRVATKEVLAAKLPGQLAEVFSTEVYGPEGPELDCDIDEIEDLAVLAARAAFDAVIARALLLQNQKLPPDLPCPDCQRKCRVDFRWGTILRRVWYHGSLGRAISSM